MLSKAPSWTWSYKPSGVFDEHLIMPCFVLSKLQQVTLGKWRRMLCKLLTTWLPKMMSLPGARMRKPGSLKDVWLSLKSSWMCWPAFSGKVDALPEEQPSLQRIEALVSDLMVGSGGFCADDSIFQWCAACLSPLPPATQMNLYLIVPDDGIQS